MSFSVNRVMLLGTLGRDPEVRRVPDGKAVANLSVATSQEWKDKDTGEKKSKTEWHRVVAWGGYATFAEKLHKGSKVYIEGSLATRKWQDQQGQDKYSTDIVVQGMGSVLIGLDGKNGQSNDNDSQEELPRTQARAPKPSVSEDMDDSIPF